MVTNISSFGRSGLYDWVVQRVSAVILLAYTVFIFAVIVCSPQMTFADWQGVFSQTWVRIFSLISLTALCAHAWIGMWTVATDYLTPMTLGAAATAVRFFFQLLCSLVLLSYFFWCVQILWGI